MATSLETIVRRGQNERPETESATLDLTMRKLSRYVSWACMRIGLSANIVTTLSICWAVVGGICLAWGGTLGFVLGGFSFWAFFIFDYADGEVARASGESSMSGHYLDQFGHSIVYMAIFCGLTTAWIRADHHWVGVLIGCLGLSGALGRVILQSLVWEVAAREHLRATKRLMNSNPQPPTDSNSQPPTDSNSQPPTDSKSLATRALRSLFVPIHGDVVVYLVLPIAVAHALVPKVWVGSSSWGVMDGFFLYASVMNFAGWALLLWKNVATKKTETTYAKMFCSQDKFE